MRHSAINRCPECGHRFRVPADEYGLHVCPSCGYDGRDAVDYIEDEADRLNEIEAEEAIA